MRSDSKTFKVSELNESETLPSSFIFDYANQNVPFITNTTEYISNVS